MVLGVAGIIILSGLTFSNMCWSTIENEQRIYNIADLVRALQNAGQKYYFEKLCGRYYYGSNQINQGNFLERVYGGGRLQPGQTTLPAAELLELYGVSLNLGAQEELDNYFGDVTWRYEADDTATLSIEYDHTARPLQGAAGEGFTSDYVARTIQARLEGGLPTTIDDSETRLVFISPVVFDSTTAPVSSSFMKELNGDRMPATCQL